MKNTMPLRLHVSFRLMKFESAICRDIILLFQVLKTEARAEEAEQASKSVRAELQDSLQKLSKVQRDVTDLTQANERLKIEVDQAKRDLLAAENLSDSSSNDGVGPVNHPNLARLRLPGTFHFYIAMSLVITNQHNY